MTNSTAADPLIQERVFAALTDPATHPRVHRIDTHAASVFLEGDRALKIKRAIRFPFLDYSTLAKRKAACDEEIRINRQFAPQVYHRVIPITQGSDGSLEIDGKGEPVEYAVEMSRFDERQTIDHLAEAGPLDTGLVEAIAEAIAASHTVAPLAQAAPWINSIPGIIEENAKAFREAACFPPGDIDDLRQASLSAFARIRPLLEQRGGRGFLRRCHGDLHLANIVLIDGKPVLFDAIEFDPVIASTDVLYDLAFPLMDFIRYGRQAEANTLLNRYLAVTESENLDALAALPLFMSLRSAIRADVLLARLNRNARDNSDTMRSARAYFELARLTIAPGAPVLVAVGGLSGTGKSVLARALAPSLPPQPGAVVLRSDVLRKQLFKVNETDRLPESAYGAEISDADLRDPGATRRSRSLAGPFRRGRCGVCPGRGTQCGPRRRAQAKCPVYRAFSRRPTLRQGCAASAAGRRTPPMPHPRLPGCRRTIISARSTGRSSMPRERQSRA